MKKRANDKIISSDSVSPLYTKNEAICRARLGVTFYVFFFSALGLVLDASLALPDVVLFAYLVCFICRKSPNDAYLLTYILHAAYFYLHMLFCRDFCQLLKYIWPIKSNGIFTGFFLFLFFHLLFFLYSENVLHVRSKKW